MITKAESGHYGVRAVLAAVILAAGLLVVLGSQARGQTQPDPVFEFLFEEGAGTTATNTGTIGAASNGSIGQGISYSADTPLGTGHSLDFEGLGDPGFPKTIGRVFVPENYDYKDQVTIEAWIKPDRADGQRVVWDDFNGYGVLLGIWDGQVQFGGSTTGNPVFGGFANFSGHIETDKWQHIAGVYDGSALKVCVDGRDTVTSVPASGEFLERIGEGGGFIGNGSGENLPFDGKIDDFRVWPVALKCDQVADGHFADTTNPTIALNSPTDGATYTQGQSVNADYSCSDDKSSGSDLSCEGTVPSGSPIDTGSVGAKTFTVTATDKAGNSETETVSYNVVKGDETAPTVTAVRPRNLSLNVPVTTNVTATFSEAMDAGTLTNATVKLEQLGARGNYTPIVANVSYDAATKTVKLDPTSDLRSGTAFRATVTTGAKDEAGNALAKNKVWYFATAKAAGGGDDDD